MKCAFHLAKITLACSLLLGSLVAAPAAEEREAVNFGIISTESAGNLKSAWQPVLDDMSKATGLKVNAFFVSDYSGVIEGMRFNKVDVAYVGNDSAIEAVDRANAEVFAQVVQKNGDQGYYSLLVVNADSRIKSVEDVIKGRAGLKLGFGDIHSTSGTLVPGYYVFSKYHVDPMRGFKRTVRANHETNLLAVINNQVDVATTNDEAVKRLSLTRPELADRVREIWRSPLIPCDPVVWRKGLDEGTRAKLREFFFSYGKVQREKDILAVLNFSGFKLSSNDQLVPFRLLGLAKQRADILAGNRSDKATSLKDIDDRLAKLNGLSGAARN